MSELMNASLAGFAEEIRLLGYRGQEVLEDDCSFIISATSGHTFLLYCYGKSDDVLTENTSDVGVIRFHAKWQNLVDYEDKELDALCNWYNLTQPFTKLFTKSKDEGTDLFIEADLYMLDGISSDSFRIRFMSFVQQFEYARKCLNLCRHTDKELIFDRHNQAIKLLHEDEADPQEAVNLYRQNAHAGYAGSQNNFGDLFEIGKIVPQDEHFAIYWYTRASERGEPTAYLSLASILEKSRDNVDALTVAAKYAILASEKLPDGVNKLSATQIRDTLKEILDPFFYELAVDLAANFKPIYEEKWTLSDAPGSKFTIASGSELLN